MYVAPTSLTFVCSGLSLSMLSSLYGVQVGKGLWCLPVSGPLSNIGLGAARLQPVLYSQDIVTAFSPMW